MKNAKDCVNWAQKMKMIEQELMKKLENLDTPMNNVTAFYKLKTNNFK